MQFIVGLGNPGTTYASTRHNIGFMVVDALLSRLSTQEISKKSFEGELFKSTDKFLLKPLTYMNLSGKSVLAVKRFYKIDMPIVIHDDLDLPFGAIRFKVGGGHSGHNGLKSIDKAIGREYIRIRMGIGRPKHGTVVDYVLGRFTDAEQAVMDGWLQRACDAILALETLKWDDVSAQFSQKKITLKDDSV
jgi:PTH1 family peptidyl-tRNA hydrolase